MALTREKKEAVIAELNELFTNSRMTVVAQYQGLTVKAIQDLRKQAKENGTQVKVIKNRLVIKTLRTNDVMKDVETSALTGMLAYAFNDNDEVAPAQVLAHFAKTNPDLQFVGAITADGKFIGADDVKALALLPSKPQLIAGIINTLNSPINGIMSGLGGNLSGILKALEAKAS